MAIDLFTKRQVADSNSFPVTVDGKTVGFVSIETWDEMDRPDYKRLDFHPPEEVTEEGTEETE